jgi:hypothetical protein
MVLDSTPDTTPAGWQIATLRGGPQHGHRFTVHDSDDRLTLHDDAGEAQEYYRVGNRPELVHQSLLNAAMRKRGR